MYLVCLHGKQSAIKFPKTIFYTTCHLELIYLDLSNKIIIFIFLRYEYYMIFINNYFYYIILCLLHQKNDCFEVSKIFHQ